uniref:N-acetyltransferase domain-containing protein n=1 Tax=Clytia hemisphaerica TaxID=252671 RepID=A0A7M5XH58_9CNID
MFLISKENEAKFKFELKQRILRQNEQLLIPIMSTLTSPMTRKIVDIYTDNLNGDKSTFIALTYPQPGEILKLFEGRDTISNDDYIGLEEQLKKCKKIFQFWSVNYQKNLDLHLKYMLEVYIHRSPIRHTPTELVENLLNIAEKSTSMVNHFNIDYYFFRTVTDHTSVYNMFEETTVDISLNDRYTIRHIQMQHFESGFKNWDEHGEMAGNRKEVLKVSVFFGLYFGAFTKDTNELAGWIASVYPGESGDLFVHPRHRANGLGNSLILYLTNRSHKEGFFLSTYYKNPERSFKPKIESTTRGFVPFSSAFTVRQ